MTEISENDQESWWRETFQIELVDSETLQRRPILHMRRWKLIVLITGLVGVIALVVYLMVAFTPVRKLLPGNFNQLDAAEIIELRNRVDEMALVLTQQDVYINTLQGLISGQPIDSLQRQESSPETLVDSKIQPIPKSEEEIQLRENMETEDRLRSLRQTIRMSGPAPGVNDQVIDLMPPLIGPIGKGYDPTVSHFGIDILAPKNTAVKSIADGLVLQSDWTVETGNSIMILHSNGIISVYKHNSSLLKEKYEKVTQGEAVAIIGNTGTMTTGPHVHFELWIDGFPADPATYINFQ